LQAPLPAIAPGAIVGEELVRREKAPIFEAGVARQMPFGSGLPILKVRLVIDHPVAVPIRFVASVTDVQP
jgi:hypothetical protein